jgi:predicted DNA-binding transcriptional regulator AlpA
MEEIMARPEITGRKAGAHGVGETTPHQARAPPKISGRRLLSYEDLETRGIPYTRVHLARLERDGLFPQRVRIGGGNFVAWLEDEVDAYVESLAAARPKRAGPKIERTEVTA